MPKGKLKRLRADYQHLTDEDHLKVEAIDEAFDRAMYDKRAANEALLGGATLVPSNASDELNALMNDDDYAKHIHPNDIKLMNEELAAEASTASLEATIAPNPRRPTRKNTAIPSEYLDLDSDPESEAPDSSESETFSSTESASSDAFEAEVLDPKKQEALTELRKKIYQLEECQEKVIQQVFRETAKKTAERLQGLAKFLPAPEAERARSIAVDYAALSTIPALSLDIPEWKEKSLEETQAIFDNALEGFIAYIQTYITPKMPLFVAMNENRDNISSLLIAASNHAGVAAKAKTLFTPEELTNTEWDIKFGFDAFSTTQRIMSLGGLFIPKDKVEDLIPSAKINEQKLSDNERIALMEMQHIDIQMVILNVLENNNSPHKGAFINFLTIADITDPKFTENVLQTFKAVFERELENPQIKYLVSYLESHIKRKETNAEFIAERSKIITSLEAVKKHYEAKAGEPPIKMYGRRIDQLDRILKSAEKTITIDSILRLQKDIQDLLKTERARHNSTLVTTLNKLENAFNAIEAIDKSMKKISFNEPSLEPIPEIAAAQTTKPSFLQRVVNRLRGKPAAQPQPEAQARNNAQGLPSRQLTNREEALLNTIKSENYGDDLKDHAEELIAKNEKAKAALFKGVSAVHSTKAREAFVKFVLEEVLYDKNTDLPERTGDLKKDAAILKALIGERGVELYEAALKEEVNSVAFRKAVFNRAFKKHKGPAWGDQLIVYVGGASGAGKTHNSKAMLEIVSEEYAGNPIIKNRYIMADGGIEREVSQMRQLMDQVSLQKGYPGILDLDQYGKKLKIKSNIKKAALATKDISVVEPDTFVKESLDPTGMLVKNKFSKNMENLEPDQKRRVICGRVIAEETVVRNQSVDRALDNTYGEAFREKINAGDGDAKNLEPNPISLTEDAKLKIPECKAPGTNFRRGNEGSVKAQMAYLRMPEEALGGKKLVIEVTNDRVFLDFDLQTKYPNQTTQITPFSSSRRAVGHIQTLIYLMPLHLRPQTASEFRDFIKPINAQYQAKATKITGAGEQIDKRKDTEKAYDAFLSELGATYKKYKNNEVAEELLKDFLAASQAHCKNLPAQFQQFLASKGLLAANPELPPANEQPPVAMPNMRLAKNENRPRNELFVTENGNRYQLVSKPTVDELNELEAAGIKPDMDIYGRAVLGQGGAGKVRLARVINPDNSLGEFVAVKKIKNEENNRRQDNVSQFAKEKEFLNICAEKNIGGLLMTYDTVESIDKRERKALYQLMPLATTDASKLFSANNDLSPNERNELFKRFIEFMVPTISNMNKNDIYHGDIKPANILYNAQNHQFYVADFGSSAANLNTDHPFGVSLSGTPSYYPVVLGGSLKEQYESRDRFALGLTLAECASRETRDIVDAITTLINARYNPPHNQIVDEHFVKSTEARLIPLMEQLNEALKNSDLDEKYTRCITHLLASDGQNIQAINDAFEEADGRISEKTNDEAGPIPPSVDRTFSPRNRTDTHYKGMPPQPVDAPKAAAPQANLPPRQRKETVFFHDPLIAPSLFQAAQYGDTKGVISAIQNGADVNAVDDNGKTALMHAVRMGHGNVVNALLNAKADITIADQQGNTVVNMVTAKNYLDRTVKNLVLEEQNRLGRDLILEQAHLAGKTLPQLMRLKLKDILNNTVASKGTKGLIKKMLADYKTINLDGFQVDLEANKLLHKYIRLSNGESTRDLHDALQKINNLKLCKPLTPAEESKPGETMLRVAINFYNKTNAALTALNNGKPVSAKQKKDVQDWAVKFFSLEKYFIDPDAMSHLNQIRNSKMGYFIATFIDEFNQKAYMPDHPNRMKPTSAANTQFFKHAVEHLGILEPAEQYGKEHGLKLDQGLVQALAEAEKAAQEPIPGELNQPVEPEANLFSDLRDTKNGANIIETKSGARYKLISKPTPQELTDFETQFGFKLALDEQGSFTFGTGGQSKVRLARKLNEHGEPDDFVAVKKIKANARLYVTEQKFHERCAALNIPGLSLSLDEAHSKDKHQREAIYQFSPIALGNGKDLEDQLHTSEPTERNEILSRATARLANTLATLHKNHLYHSDIKPENLLIGQDGQVLLTDFSSYQEYNNQGKPISDVPPSTTSDYIPPRHRGTLTLEEAAKMRDAWALGLTLAELASPATQRIAENIKALIATEGETRTEKSYAILQRALTKEYASLRKELKAQHIDVNVSQMMLGLLNPDKNSRLSIEDALNTNPLIAENLNEQELEVFLEEGLSDKSSGELSSQEESLTEELDQLPEDTETLMKAQANHLLGVHAENGFSADIDEDLANGADVNTVTGAGTPLMIAAFHGRQDLVAHLLDKGADPLITATVDGEEMTAQKAVEFGMSFLETDQEEALNNLSACRNLIIEAVEARKADAAKASETTLASTQALANEMASLATELARGPGSSIPSAAKYKDNLDKAAVLRAEKENLTKTLSRSPLNSNDLARAQNALSIADAALTETVKTFKTTVMQPLAEKIKSSEPKHSRREKISRALRRKPKEVTPKLITAAQGGDIDTIKELLRYDILSGQQLYTPQVKRALRTAIEHHENDALTVLLTAPVTHKTSELRELVKLASAVQNNEASTMLTNRIIVAEYKPTPEPSDLTLNSTHVRERRDNAQNLFGAAQETAENEAPSFNPLATYQRRENAQNFFEAAQEAARTEAPAAAQPPTETNAADELDALINSIDARSKAPSQPEPSVPPVEASIPVVADPEDPINQLLRSHVTAGNITGVTDALALGADIETTNLSDYTCLMVAAQEGNYMMVKHLLDHQANPLASTKNGENSITLINQRMNDLLSRTPFTETHKKIVEDLNLARGFIVNAISKLENPPAGFNYDVRTPLEKMVAAIRTDDTEAVKDILEAENDLCVEHYAGTPVFMLACASENADIVSAFTNVGIREIGDLTDAAGNTALTAAIQRNSNIADKLIEKNMGINKPDNNGNTPLHHAITKDNEALVTALLARKLIEKDARNNEGETPLLKAAKLGHKKAFNALLKKGANPLVTDKNGDTALMHAVKHKDEAMIAALLNKNALPNAKNKKGETPLSVAKKMAKASHKDSHLFEDFIEGEKAPSLFDRFKAKLVRKPNEDSEATPLMDLDADDNEEDDDSSYDTDYSSTDSSESSDVDATVDLDASDSTEALSSEELFATEAEANQALATAIEENDQETVKKLAAQSQFNLDWVGRNPNSPHLLTAADKSNTQIASIIIAKGADLDKSINTSGITALHFAALYNNTELTSLLLEKTNYQNKKDATGFTPLMVAAFHGRTDAATAIAYHKDTDLALKDNTGQTALLIALSRGHDNIAGIILAAAAQNKKPAAVAVNAKIPATGETALMLAAKNSKDGDISTIRALIEAGANIYEKNNDGKTFIDFCDPATVKAIEALAKPSNQAGALPSSKREKIGGFFRGLFPKKDKADNEALQPLLKEVDLDDLSFRSEDSSEESLSNDETSDLSSPSPQSTSSADSSAESSTNATSSSNSRSRSNSSADTDSEDTSNQSPSPSRSRSTSSADSSAASSTNTASSSSSRSRSSSSADTDPVPPAPPAPQPPAPQPPAPPAPAPVAAAAVAAPASKVPPFTAPVAKAKPGESMSLSDMKRSLKSLLVDDARINHMLAFAEHAALSITDSRDDAQLQKIERTVEILSQRLREFREHVVATQNDPKASDEVKNKANNLMGTLKKMYENLPRIDTEIEKARVNGTKNRGDEKIGHFGESAKLFSQDVHGTGHYTEAKKEMDEFFRGQLHSLGASLGTTKGLTEVSEKGRTVFEAHKENELDVKSASLRTVVESTSHEKPAVRHELHFRGNDAQKMQGRQRVGVHSIPCDPIMQWAIARVLDYKKDAKLDAGEISVNCAGLTNDAVEALRIVAKLHDLTCYTQNTSLQLTQKDIESKAKTAEKKYGGAGQILTADDAVSRPRGPR